MYSSPTPHKVERHGLIIPHAEAFVDPADGVEKYYVGRRNVHHLEASIIDQIAGSHFAKPDVLIAITRGGEFPFYTLSEVFPHALHGHLPIKRYKNAVEGHNAYVGNINWAPSTDGTVRPPETASTVLLGSVARVLVIEEIYDTGKSHGLFMAVVRKALPSICSNQVFQIKTAAFFRKASSVAKPDFCAIEVPNNPETGKSPWIVFHWEVNHLCAIALCKSQKLGYELPAIYFI